MECYFKGVLSLALGVMSGLLVIVLVTALSQLHDARFLAQAMLQTQLL